MEENIYKCFGNDPFEEALQKHSAFDEKQVYITTAPVGNSTETVARKLYSEQQVVASTKDNSIDDGYQPEDQDYDSFENEIVLANGSDQLPNFEEVVELKSTIAQMPFHRQKQFIFLHEIVNSSSDDSNYSGTESANHNVLETLSSLDNTFHHFELLEIPIPIKQAKDFAPDSGWQSDLHELLNCPRLTFYTIPMALKHLLCTNDNLIGLNDTMMFERIIRRKLLSDVIPMSSRGTRQFFQLSVEFTPVSGIESSITNLKSLISTLTTNFYQRMGSSFNTTFQFSYNFENGKYEAKYGIFEDLSHLSSRSSKDNYIELHVFSRFLSGAYLCNINSISLEESDTNSEKAGKGWKSFMTMEEVFYVIEYMLKGKKSWIQNDGRLLRFIRTGGSLKEAAREYNSSEIRNYRRILSNVKKFIINKEVMSLEEAEKMGIRKQRYLEFHNGLYEQIVGFNENLGRKTPKYREKIHVIELEDFEDVISSIMSKLVYERYDDARSQCSLSKDVALF